MSFLSTSWYFNLAEWHGNIFEQPPALGDFWDLLPK